MARLIYACASSHAFAVEDPSRWDADRLNNRRGYERRYGVLPPEPPQVAAESDADLRERHARIAAALDAIARDLEARAPEALVLVADDQNEQFVDSVLPQIAIYTGPDLVVGREPGVPTRSHPALAEAILESCIAGDIDAAAVPRLSGDRLFAHAFGPVLRRIDPDARIPLVPIFVNAIHTPAPSPQRCFYLGRRIRAAIDGCAAVDRVAICGSGGLSHFTAGYPWKAYTGTYGHGEIDADFDRWLVDRITAGDVAALAGLSSADLLAHGEIELRSWIVTLGALGAAKPQRIVYEALYRGLMGMGVASWS